MLFNSAVFIFAFLPFVVLFYYFLNRKFTAEISFAFLVLASLFFYGWWNPVYLLLLSASIIGNFYIGKLIYRRKKKILLVFGIVLNLASIAYYKYAGFLVFNFAYLTGSNITIDKIVLPLAISFFTFQQIAYLVDVWKAKAKEYNFIHYCLFVTFFPQLIAGPIVHHSEMLPQFEKNELKRIQDNLAIGISIFAIGLFKKTVIADNLAVYANPIFQQADSGVGVDFFSAWLGTLAYSLQLYFDFSGYSDMAIGLARMFGIILPLNFYSPYKAFSIVEFWRRWHITLSRFLRDYVYIPMGGNQHGRTKKYIFLMSTMLLGGLWHGAGWNFVIWGGLHGLYLIVNHGWIAIIPGQIRLAVPNFFYWLVTILAVMVGWVFFRATTVDGAFMLLDGMSGMNGLSLPNAIIARLGEPGDFLTSLGVTTYHGGGSTFIFGWLTCLAAIPVALFFPNIQDLFVNYRPTLRDDPFKNGVESGLIFRLQWSPEKRWSIIVSILLLVSMMTLGQISDFLYFQF